MPEKDPTILNKGYDATWLRQHLWLAVLDAFPEGASKKSIAISRLGVSGQTDEERAEIEAERARILRAVTQIENLIAMIEIKPERSGMVAEHIPAVNVAECNTIFFEASHFPHLIVEPEPYRVELHPLVRLFLDTTAPGWSVTMDRGDWGEGIPHVTITVPFKRHVALFLDRFGERKPKGYELPDPPSPADE